MITWPALTLPMHAGLLADDEDAVAVADGDHVALHLAVDAQASVNRSSPCNDGAFADQAADRRLLSC